MRRRLNLFWSRILKLSLENKRLKVTLLFANLGIKCDCGGLNSKNKMRRPILIIEFLKFSRGQEPQNSPTEHEEHDDHSEFKEDVFFNDLFEMNKLYDLGKEIDSGGRYLISFIGIRSHVCIGQNASGRLKMHGCKQNGHWVHRKDLAIDAAQGTHKLLETQQHPDTNQLRFSVQTLHSPSWRTRSQTNVAYLNYLSYN